MILPAEVLEQSDGTAWMPKFCLNMLEMALLLANRNSVYEVVAIKFFEHFASIAAAMENLWDEQDGFFYDCLRTRDGSAIGVRARAMVGLPPVFAPVGLEPSLWHRLPMFRERARWYIEHKLGTKNHLYYLPSGGRPGLISLVEKSRFQRILARMLDESEFLSPYGLRSLSRYHQEHPVVLDFDGRTCRLDYEPVESRSGLFGGNSNWRGPVWFPLNLLAIESLRHLHNFFGDDLAVEQPTGSGKKVNLHQVAAELERRLLSLFLLDANGRRPATEQTHASRTIRHGEIPSSSMNTSMARPERVSEPLIRLAGRPWPGRSFRTGALTRPPNRKAETAQVGANFWFLALSGCPSAARIGTFLAVPSLWRWAPRFAPSLCWEKGALDECARTSNCNQRQ